MLTTMPLHLLSSIHSSIQLYNYCFVDLYICLSIHPLLTCTALLVWCCAALHLTLPPLSHGLVWLSGLDA